jgi:hypothetical protein
MKDIKVNLCGRYRFFVFFVSILVIWGVAWLILAVVQGRIIDGFHLLKIGMSRDEIILGCVHSSRVPLCRRHLWAVSTDVRSFGAGIGGLLLMIGLSP